MSGVRVYSMYLNNIVGCIDGYTLTKNLSSSSVSISDVTYVAKDLDSVLYLSNSMEFNGEGSLLRTRNFLTKKLPMDASGIMLSDIGVDIVSKDVLKYCGDLLESGKPIDSKKLGKLFKDISDGLVSASSLSSQLINDVYISDNSDGEEAEYDLDDDFYAEYEDNFEDDYEDEDINIVKEAYESPKKDNISNIDSRYSDDMGDSDLLVSYGLNDISTNNVKEDESSVLNTEFDVESIKDGNANDKLAYAISKMSNKLSKTPTKIRDGGKVIYSNVLDFDV